MEIETIWIIALLPAYKGIAIFGCSITCSTSKMKSIDEVFSKNEMKWEGDRDNSSNIHRIPLTSIGDDNRNSHLPP